MSDALSLVRADLRSWALMFDIDGTLAPIAPRPELAKVSDATRAHLERLAGICALVGCISGRPALEARELVGLQALHYAGNHGYESLAPGDPEPELAPAVAADSLAASKFVAALDQKGLTSAGIRVEDKGVIQALHWRGSHDEEAAAALAQDIAADAERVGLYPRGGRLVLELRPVDSVDKGTAVCTMLERTPAARNAMHAGDDITDLDAFRALAELRTRGRLDAYLRVGVASQEGPDAIVDEADVVVEGVAGMSAALGGLVG